MKIIKTSQFNNGDLNSGISKKTFVNQLYRAINPYTKGFFTDTSWQPIHNVINVFKEMNLDWNLIKSYYDNEMPNKSKTWKFEINFTNNRGKPDKIYGTIVAAGAGTVDDPLSRYDVTVVMG